MKDPILRMAGQICRRLEPRTDPTCLDHALAVCVGNVLTTQRALEAAWLRAEKARRRGWAGAALRCRAELFRLARLLDAQRTPLLHHEANSCRRDSESPSLRGVIDELRQLADEFGEDNVVLELSPSRDGPRVTARTEPVVLQELELGPFAIELHVRRLDCRADASCFDVVALEPNPAAGSPDVVHPHVSGRGLCAGDAAVPIARALSEGRLADAFCLVRSVLTTYNPHSPYVSIESWDGVRCADCGGSMAADDLCACGHCGDDFCDHCIGTCDLCDASACQGCLERDPVSRRDCCPNCRSACRRCGRVVDDEHFHADTELCPECHSTDDQEKQQEEQEDQNDLNDEPEPQTRSTTPQPGG